MSKSIITRSSRFQDEAIRMIANHGINTLTAPQSASKIPDERTKPFLGARMDYFLQGICAARGVEMDMVLPAALVAISAAAGSKVKINAAGYVNTCNIWACVVGNSGVNKSQPAADAFAPLTDINTVLFDIYNEEVGAALKANASAKKKVDEGTLMRTIKRSQLLICDTTPEARNQALLDNPHGLLLYADELSTFLGGLDRYSAGNDSAQLMSIYDGKDLQINRKSDFMQCIKKPFLSVFGTIQPQLFIDLMMNDKMINSGFSQRMLVFYPDTMNYTKFTNLKPIAPEVIKDWRDLIENLYNYSGEIELRFTPVAEALYAAFYDHMSELINDEDTSDAVASCISKMRISVLKLAALIALSYMGETEKFDSYIHVGDLHAAILIAMRLVDNYQSFYEAAHSTDEVLLSKKELARQLLLQYPQLATKEFLMDKLGVSQPTAWRWIKEFGSKTEGTAPAPAQPAPDPKPSPASSTPESPANATDPDIANIPGMTRKNGLLSFSLTEALKHAGVKNE